MFGLMYSKSSISEFKLEHYDLSEYRIMFFEVASHMFDRLQQMSVDRCDNIIQRSLYQIIPESQGYMF